MSADENNPLTTDLTLNPAVAPAALVQTICVTKWASRRKEIGISANQLTRQLNVTLSRNRR